MDYGAGFAVGIACGMSCGLAPGIATGRRKAQEELRRNLREYVERQGIMLLAQEGRSVPVDELLDAALPRENSCRRPRGLVLALLLGLALLVALGVVVFFLLARS